MGQTSGVLSCEKMVEMEEETTRNNQFGSESFRDNRYPCIWGSKFAWSMCNSICSHITVVWIQARITCKQIRIVKKQLTISRLGLAAAQMVTNLANNIRNSWPKFNIREVYGWSDSTVVLFWLVMEVSSSY